MRLITALLAACLWVPDVQKALGRVFVWDQFRNWDASIMMPGWVYIHGGGLNTDIFSPWGMGAVMFISRCSQILGGFDHAHVLMVMMAMVIMYYMSLYAFLRAWLGSVMLAAALTAVAVKVQMFHSGISPLIWIYPQDTPLRHWLDLPVLWCLWQHSRSYQKKYLILAACGTGAALAWSLGTGLCLLAAFWGYLVFLSTAAEGRSLVRPGYKAVRATILAALLPLGVMGAILFLLQGGAVVQAQFWNNMVEPLQLFLQGAGALPLYACLYDRHFFAFITGFVVPVIYVWTLMVVKDIFLIALGIYGLGLYMHYLAHASTSHYYAVGIPLVMVIGYWISKVVPRSRILLLLAIGAWGALFTNILFVYYPNIFNISRMDRGPEVNAWRSQFVFDQDAALIARLTAASGKAAVISSFETQMLMQAGRGPFFYYAPLVSSNSLITQQRLEKTIGQIAARSPEYIFIEKRLLGQWPPALAQRFPGIILVLRYISEHYSPQEQGTYLIAMHRKRNE